MRPDELLLVLTDQVPFEMRARPVRLRVGTEEVLCDSVDEAKLRLTRRPSARRDDWALVRDHQGKQVWVNLQIVLDEEKSLWAKQQALSSEPAPDAPPLDFDLLQDGLRRRKYVPSERRLLEWITSSMRTSNSTLSMMSHSGAATSLDSSPACQ